MLLFYTDQKGATLIQDAAGNIEKYHGIDNLIYCVLDFKRIHGYKMPADLIRY